MPFGEKRRDFFRTVLTRICGSAQISAVLGMVMCVYKREAEHHLYFLYFLFHAVLKEFCISLDSNFRGACFVACSIVC